MNIDDLLSEEKKKHIFALHNNIMNNYMNINEGYWYDRDKNMIISNYNYCGDDYDGDDDTGDKKKVFKYFINLYTILDKCLKDKLPYNKYKIIGDTKFKYLDIFVSNDNIVKIQ